MPVQKKSVNLLNTPRKYVFGEMVDFGKSDKMIRICGKVKKTKTKQNKTKNNTDNGFNNISFFIDAVLFLIKNEI